MGYLQIRISENKLFPTAEVVCACSMLTVTVLLLQNLIPLGVSTSFGSSHTVVRKKKVSL